MMASPKTEFSVKVLGCIESGLDSLGAIAKKVVFGYLSNKQGLEKEQIPDDPTEFVKVIRSLFGQGGEMLEQAIVKELKSAFDVDTKKEQLVEVLGVIKARQHHVS